MAYKYLLNEPSIDEKEIEHVIKVLKAGWLSNGGEFTKKFEQAFAAMVGVKYALAVQSGTAALHTAILALGIGPGDKVVVPTYTCGACVSSVLQTGAEPLIIDAEPKTFGLDIKILEKALKEDKKIKAVMIVHVYGFPVRDFDKIIRLCQQYKVKLIEDCSEAHGAEFQGKRVGSFGDIATFSIRSEKMIGVGEGGLVLTNNSELMDQVYYYASRAAPHRREKDPWWHKYIYTGVGMNYLLPHTLGAIGLAQMDKFPHLQEKKRSIAKKYKELFQSVKGVTLQEVAPNTYPAYWLNAIILEHEEGEVRVIGEELMKQGLEIRPAFWPLGDLEAFKKYAYGSQENGKWLLEHLIVLPSSVKLSENNCQAVSEVVNIVSQTLDKFK